MSAPAVVVSDVGRGFLSGDVAILVRFHFELGLDGSEARLDEGLRAASSAAILLAP